MRYNGASLGAGIYILRVLDSFLLGQGTESCNITRSVQDVPGVVGKYEDTVVIGRLYTDRDGLILKHRHAHVVNTTSGSSKSAVLPFFNPLSILLPLSTTTGISGSNFILGSKI